MKIYNDYYEERLYSTGSDELDSLLEKAFCDGYEYAQREFAKKDDKEEDDVKFKKGDAFNYGMNYKLMLKNGLAAKLEKDRLEGDTKKNVRNAAGGAALGTGIRHKLEPKSEKYKKAWEKQQDLFAVKQGDMTKKEFVKKWGGKINGEKIEGTEEKKMKKAKKK